MTFHRAPFYILTVALSIYLSEPRLLATEATTACDKVETESIWYLAGKYVGEVWRSRGLRIILKKFRPQDIDSNQGFFLRLYERPVGEPWYLTIVGRTIQYLPKKISKFILGREYELTPLRGPYYWLIQQPTTYLTQFANAKRQKYITTIFTEMVYYAIVSGGILGYVVDPINDQVLAAKVNTQIQAHEAELLKEAEYDYRYQFIYKSWKNNKLTKDEAVKAIAGTKMLMRSQLAFILTGKQEMSPQEYYDAAKESPFFADIKFILENGVKNADGFDVPADKLGPINDKTREMLFAIRELYLLKCDLIALSIEKPEEYEKIRSLEHIKAVVDSIEGDEFVKALRILRERKTISANDLRYRMQEDAFWQSKFALWEAVGVTKLRRMPDGSYGKPLSIDDIRFETIDELRNNIR